MKTTKHTHKAFDGTTVVKGWVLEDGYGNKSWVYFNGVDICVHPASDWYDELTEVEHIDDIVETINKIDEPQKVVVPKFVAEWLEYCKRSGWHLQKALYRLDVDEKVGGWAYSVDNLMSEKVDIFARAWLDGYEIEQEKLYTVEIPQNIKYGSGRRR